MEKPDTKESMFSPNLEEEGAEITEKELSLVDESNSYCHCVSLTDASVGADHNDNSFVEINEYSPAPDANSINDEPSNKRSVKKKVNKIGIKFLLPNGQIFVEEFNDTMLIIEVKSYLGTMFRVCDNYLQLHWDKEILLDAISLSELPIDFKSQIATLKLKSTDKNADLSLKCRGSKTVQKITLQTRFGDIKEIEIIVEDKRIIKPFLGGYKEKVGSREFHHASSQTRPYYPPERTYEQFDRDSQTVKVHTCGMNTVCAKATQMFRNDHFIPCAHDVIKTPGHYITTEEIEKQRNLLHHVRTIQRYCRAWLIRRRLKKLCEERRRQLAREEEQERKRLVDKEIRIKRDIVVKAFPRTRGDFEMLYEMVEDWRKSEILQIKKTNMCEASKKARYFNVLEKEIQLIKNIEQHRLAIKNEHLRKKEIEIINKCSQPITWTGHKGLMISMDTLRTQRARELTEIYKSLSKNDISVEHRIDLLMHLKKAMEPYTHKEVEEVIDLINRECDLLVRSLSNNELDILRERFRKLFMKILMMPIFNPETAKYSMEYSNLGLEFEMFQCQRCKNLLPRWKFYPNTKSRRLQYCVSCAWLENIAIPRTDLGPYRFMLRSVRREERRRGSYSSVAFVMQDEDFKHLVANIWHGRSAISQNEYIKNLRMSRWDIRRDWAPWNCILLTDDEARAHVRIDDYNQTYEVAFKAEVDNKHLLARNQFQGLAKLDKYLRESGQWTKIQDTKIYRPPSPKTEFVEDICQG